MRRKVDATAEAADRFFSPFLNLGKDTSQLSDKEALSLFSDLHKTISFFIIANSAGIKELTLQHMQIKSYTNFESEYEYYRIGVNALISMGLVGLDGKILSITEKGRMLHSFINNPEMVDAWLKKTRCNDGIGKRRREHNSRIVRSMISSEQRVVETYAKGEWTEYLKREARDIQEAKTEAT